MNVIWAAMIAASIVYAAATGHMEDVSRAVTDGAYEAAAFILSTGGIICLWSGILRAAEASGATEAVKRLLSPVLHRLFKERNPEILDKISENVTANILGAGNAATPAGISAVGGMVGGSRGRITRDIAVFTVLNTASVQVFPATVIAMRAGAGSAEPCAVLPFVWIASAVSAGIALLCVWAVWRLRG